MSYELQNYVPPTIDLSTQVKRHCRIPVSYTGDDTILADYLAGAIAQVEADSERLLGYADVVLTANPDEVDCQNLSRFRWPVVPLVGTPTVEYMDEDGVWQDADDVTVIVIPGEPAIVCFDASSLTLYANESIPRFRITAACGYNPDDEAADYKPLPRNAIPTILMWVAESYRNREPLVYARANASFKIAYNARVQSLRWRVYP